MKKIFSLSLILISLTSFSQETLQQSFPEKLFSEGIFMMSNSNYGSARQYFDRYLETKDDTYEEIAVYNLAKSALNLYHLDAELLIDEYIQKFSSSQLALMAKFDLGIYFFHDKNYKKTIHYLNEVNPNILNKSQKQDLLYKLAYSYFSQREFTKAITYFNSLKSEEGKYQNLSIYYSAYIEFVAKEYDTAIEDLQLLIDDVNFSNSVALLLSAIYYEKNDYISLIRYLEPLITSNKKLTSTVEISIFLAEAYFYNNQFSNASKYYKYSFDKLSPEAVYNYATSLSKTGHIEEAINVLKKEAGNSNPIEVATTYLLGKLYIIANKKIFALGAFLQIDDVENKEVAEEANFLIAKLYSHLGRTTQSIETSHKFLDKYPSSAHKEEVENLLAKTLLQTNNYSATIAYIEGHSKKSKELKNTYQKASYLLAVQQFNNREFRKAVANFAKSNANGTNKLLHIQAHLYTGESFSLARRYTEAITHYNYVIVNDFNQKSKEALLAQFGLGYALYNLGKYTKAKRHFKTFITSTEKDNPRYARALVRLADCEYINKKYMSSLGYYNKAIENVYKEKDYAYYQMGVIYHIKQQYDTAILYLDKLSNEYKRSPYRDDANFEKGAIYLEMGYYEQAIASFTNLILKYPRSKYIPFALEKRALSNFNQKKYANTILDYELFLKKYPSHPSIQNVLLGLQQAYSLDGRSTNFNTTLNRFKNDNPTIEGLEILEFDAIKEYFNEGLYEKSEEKFTEFIANYPNDANLLNAKFILAESFFRQQKNKRALKLYYEIANENTFDLMFRVLERIADLEYLQANYKKAIQYYDKLSKASTSLNQQYRATSGLMKSYYSINAYDSVFIFSKKLLKTDGTRSEFLVIANLYEGKTFLAKNNFEEAILKLEKTTSIADNESGAEAQYLIGKIKYLQHKFDESNEVLYNIAQKYGNYLSWVDKSFLLIADNFIGKNEIFQAKATLQSIIDNASSTSSKVKAQDKLDSLIAQDKTSKTHNDTLHITLKDSILDE